VTSHYEVIIRVLAENFVCVFMVMVVCVYVV
jgi:hypothetical protein